MELLIKNRVTGKFSEIGAKRTVWFRLWWQNIIKKSNEIFYYDQTDSLQQTLANISIFIISVVLIVDYGRKWCHFTFKGICGLNTNNSGLPNYSFDFFSNSIVCSRRMVQSIYAIKHSFIKAILFWDVIVNRSQFFLIIFCGVMWQKIIFYEI